MNSMDDFSDTRPEVHALYLALLRQASPARKLAMLGEINQTVRTLALSGLRSRYPDAPPEVLRRRLMELLLGPEITRQVNDWLDKRK